MCEEALLAAHHHSCQHLDELLASDICGCFQCLEIFPPGRISEWIDHGQTALCPRCGTDSLIGSAAGFPLTRAFLREMRRHWFRPHCRPEPSRLVRFFHRLLGRRHVRRWSEYRALLERADTDTKYHRDAILASQLCGCYWCMSIFPPVAVRSWIDEDLSGVGQTAECPCCGEAGVLGSADGYPLTRRFLRDVRRPFF